MPATAVPSAVATVTLTWSPAPGAALRPTENAAVLVAEVERSTAVFFTDTVYCVLRLITVAVPTGSARLEAVGDDSARLKVSFTPRRVVGDTGTDTVWICGDPAAKFRVPDCGE